MLLFVVCCCVSVLFVVCLVCAVCFIICCFGYVGLLVVVIVCYIYIYIYMYGLPGVYLRHGQRDVHDPGELLQQSIVYEFIVYYNVE